MESVKCVVKVLLKSSQNFELGWHYRGMFGESGQFCADKWRLDMDYTKTSHDLKQSPELALRQEEAFNNFAPQADVGSLLAAVEETYKEFDAQAALDELEYDDSDSQHYELPEGS